MKKSLIGILGVVSFSIVSCGEAKEENHDEVKEEKVETCMFSLNSEGIEVNWTAFKFTEKAGVGGKFDSVVVSGSSSSEKINGAVVNCMFEIYTASVNSNNPDRDAKLANGFYGSMENADIISGQIMSVNDDGSGVVLINMNGVEKEAPFTWTFSEENIFSLTTNVNVPDWNAQASLDSLNQMCYDLHTGADGVSKLWPDVDISVNASFTKECK